MKFISSLLQQVLEVIGRTIYEAEARQREAYLAQSADLADLERRQRELMHPSATLTAFDYYARG